MEKNKRIQNAGDNSNQLQADVINITTVTGITEQKAREICKETFRTVRQEFTKEAYQCAQKRVEEFEDALMPKLSSIENALEAFKEPSFQSLLAEAQRTAACTERLEDYDMLSELLIQRIEYNEDRKRYTGIKKAISIVDQVDDDALCGLTIAHCLLTLTPVTGNVINGLNVLENIFAPILSTELPSDLQWLDQLEILNAVRINTLTSLNKIENILRKKMSGYACVGIKNDSYEYDKARQILTEVGLEDMLVDNIFLNGYSRVAIANLDIREGSNVSNIIKMGELYGMPLDFPVEISMRLDAEKANALKTVIALYSKDSSLKKAIEEKFEEEWKKRNSLLRIGEWWNKINVSFSPTLVGSLLAHANAQKFDKKIPNI